ncbi:hypothetical protein [Acidovorax sp. sic0104]|uniref:hypothetical protein n=1 Tax=Acidovorax sp. sic0104 TaxID=2854784 RepID=UPI001C483EC1|nr:hypothetical protein [Acidovorax sp. sic0104]MBV7542185.1 hypothetical protein [Acidovorax sp. sic0104]
MQTNKGSLDLGESLETQSSAPTALAEGETRWIGNWEVRNFHGYYQSREGGTGPWKFHISSFDSSSTGQCGYCSLVLAGGGRLDVPIDARDQIMVLGVRYGRKNWAH